MNVSTNDIESSCLQILTQEIGKTRVEERFRVDTRPKEIINPKNILTMFELNFSKEEIKSCFLKKIESVWVL